MFSLLTPKVALIPAAFFEPDKARDLLSRTVVLSEKDEIGYISMPEYSAVLVYSLSVGNARSSAVPDRYDVGTPGKVLPEMYFILKDLRQVKDYNRILASYADGYLHLAIGQGNNLLLANVFKAADFATAEYFIFLAMKKVQLNPEVSSIYFRTPLSEDWEMSLYRYFNSVESM